MYPVFFRSSELVKTIKLERQKTVTANWCTTKCLTEILQECNVRGLMLQHDSASSYTARLRVVFLKQKQLRMIKPWMESLSSGSSKNIRGHRFYSEEEIDVGNKMTELVKHSGQLKCSWQFPEYMQKSIISFFEQK
ncbi:UNVERIFIED_CONTAM: hypothetical protein NCL1_27295 [Trichonephila clavipes]